MKRAWVLGSGGMLGGAVIRELHSCDAEVYRYSQSFEWKSPKRVRAQFDEALRELMAGLTTSDSWEIYWAAGVGYMGSVWSDLDGENTVFQEFLVSLGQCLSRCLVPGVIGFASSAGALYADSPDFEITEETPVTVVNDYASAKLSQERLLEDFVLRHHAAHVMIARFTTLYGPGQAQGKRQGLLSHIARCTLRHQPVEIFVPLDTSRDYLFIHDAARDFVISSRALQAGDERFQVRIIAAERSITISEIISTFNRLNKKRLRIICNRNKLSSLYATRVAYRSVSSLAAGREVLRHTLIEGLAAVLLAERMAYVAGPKTG
jgi:UDP-glucose 4-epimerase